MGAARDRGVPQDPVESVLTVLAEGEPRDVIPTALLRHPTVVELEDGTTQEAMVEA